MNVSFLFRINLAVFLVCFCETALTPEVKREYSGFLSGNGLYNDDDGIVLLNATNFKVTIYGTGNAWLVEFYNSWCGHCHKFAPVWKTLAANIQEWRNVLQLAAIDCSKDENTPICRDYDIMAYPTVKFFSASSPPSSMGTELVKMSQSEKNITRDVVGILQKEQLEGRGNQWPNVLPYRNYDTSTLWENSPSVRYIFLIFAEENDPISTEVTLDLSNVKDVLMRGVAADNEVLAKYLGVQSYPSVVMLERSNKEPEFLHPEENNRRSFRLAIKSFLQEKGIAVPDEPKVVKILPPNETPSMKDLQEARDAYIRLQKIKELGDVVFLIDLENTLRYSLQHEVSSRKIISGEALKALNNFLGVLAKYFPMRESGVYFMQKLRDTVFAENEIKGVKFNAYLKNLTEGGLESVLSTNEDWTGCRGSEDYFRGYPCGLWTLFHYMTVNALENSGDAHFDHMEVLDAMVGYITNFFGCSHCASHFQEMVSRSMKAKVTDGVRAVLWLWSSHNEVNQRLANDETEDPEFPKIMFPAQERCSNCRDASGQWEEEKVLDYLKTVYSSDNLNQMGSNWKLYFPNKSNAIGSSDYHFRSELFEEEAPKKINKDFNIFDISLCVVLYVVSAIICVGVCLKFILKKRHMRKSHGQDLFGRV